MKALVLGTKPAAINDTPIAFCGTPENAVKKIQVIQR